MNSPFKFLDAYTKEDADIFFGRTSDIQTVFEKIHRGKLLLVYGASGTGKTSLVNCGLGKKFADTDWLPLFITRKDNINKAFDRAINQRAKSMIPRVQVNAQGTIVEYPIDKKVQRLYLDYYKPIFLILALRTPTKRSRCKWALKIEMTKKFLEEGKSHLEPQVRWTVTARRRLMVLVRLSSILHPKREV